MRQLRLTVVAALVAVLCVAIAPSAAAGELVDAAVTGLRTDNVYVHPSMRDTLSPEEVSDLRLLVAASPTPIYIAVLPNDAKGEAGGSADGLPRLIGEKLGTGTVAVIAGNSFRAGSSVLGRGEAGRLATEVFNDKRDDGRAAVLTEYVSVSQTSAAPTGSQTRRQIVNDEEKDEGFPWVALLLILLGLFVIGGAVWFFLARARQNKKVEKARTVADSKVSALGSKVVEYSGVSDPQLNEAAERYTWANSRLSKAQTVDELEEITRAAEEGLRLVRGYEGVEEPEPEKVQTFTQAYDGPERQQQEYEGGRYYEGGYYQNRWYGPGWYPDGFMSGWMWGSMMSGGYGHHDVHHYSDEGSRSDDSGGGDWGGGGYDSGGGDWGGGSDSGGGGDWGGGGGGGGDFGGGDSGGGGGGDW